MLRLAQLFVLFMVALAVSAIAIHAQEKTEAKPKGRLEGPIIGIDLGTTYSCVGIYRNGKVEIIPNEQGNRITPSYVAFTNSDERLIGDAAKNQATLNPQNTVYDIKRFIGRRFKDTTVQHDRSLLPFSIVDQQGRPYVQIATGDSKKTYSPEEISAMVLTKMKEIAENYIGGKIVNAVITVPAYFNDAQRQATKDAGTIAGLNVVRVINEPTAAAIAYGIDRQNKEHKILVFDLGGGTFDVTVLTIDDGVFEVAATNGDTHLGGEDFDQRIVQYYSEKIKKEHGIDVTSNKRSLAKLRRAAEIAKRTLSTETSALIDIEGLLDGGDFSDTLTRAKFEQLNEDLFQKTLAPVTAVLKDSNLKKHEIDEIVLVGGSTKIPRVQDLLTKFFNGKKLNKQVNPDEAVAYGAAVQGGVLTGEQLDLILIDVTPLTLGLEVVGGVMLNFIKRNTPIPTKKTKILTTESDFQTSIPITVYQGERPKCKDNVKLGHFDMEGIPPMKRGVPQIEVTFELDANGILSVTAVDKGTGKTGNIKIEADKGALSKDEIERMVKEAEAHAEQDKVWKERVKKHQDLENLVYNIRHTAESEAFQKAVSSTDARKLETLLNDVEEWLESNPVSSINDVAEIDNKRTELQKSANPILSKLYKDTGYDGGDDDEGKEDRMEHEDL